MAPFDRKEADRLFTRLLEVPPEERAALLDEASDDTDLREAVERLLYGAKAEHSYVDPGSEWTRDLWAGVADEAAALEAPVVVGEMVGPYRILEELARGGMAVVYRAERVDGEFRREVAVKVLKLGIDTEEVVRRFEQERQILADLDHPGVARFYDAGRTGDGRPYLVMELVEGVPIDRYCNEHRLSVEERLELFCVVADAVDYAHQNLVVHRDLKPSNILVARRGREGNRPEDTNGRQRPVVKLLDFGIARLLEAEAGDRAAALATRAMLRMMTPEYASPEQVRGERVTTASDVYQLGLLLYELLTGHRAYAVSDRSPAAIEQTICEQAPTRPSAAVAREELVVPAKGLVEAAGIDDGGAVEAICRARRSTPARLRRRLRGDLDNVVLRALRKEPHRRYRTADRLAQDIRRHLRGLPVTARAATWLYRSRKFLERHALGASVTALLLAVAASMGVFHTLRIGSERDRAQAEAARAERVSAFLTSLFEGADPNVARGTELTARELLDRGVGQMDRELAGEPDSQAQMLLVLGTSYLELGVYESAERLLRRSLELRRSRLGPEHPDTAWTQSRLGVLRQAQARYEPSRTLLEEAVRSLETSDAHVRELADTLRALGETYRRMGDFDMARAAIERALTIHAEADSGDPVLSARIMNGLGIVFTEQGAYERAEEQFERSITILGRELGEDHPRVGLSLLNLAIVNARQGKLDEAEAKFRRVLAIDEKAYGPFHDRVGGALHNLGHHLVVTEQYDEAIEVLQRAVDVQGAALGPNHPRLALPLGSLGLAHMAAGNPREARESFRRTVAMRAEALQGERFDSILFRALVALGRIHAELGDSRAAEQNLQRALSLWQRQSEPVDSRFTPSLRYLGHWLVEHRRCAEAVPLLQHAAELPLAHPYPLGSGLESPEALLAACE